MGKAGPTLTQSKRTAGQSSALMFGLLCSGKEEGIKKRRRRRKETLEVELEWKRTWTLETQMN